MGLHQMSDDEVLMKAINFSKRIQNAQSENVEKPRTLSQTGGFVELLVALDDTRLDNSGIIDIASSGFGLVYAARGSSAGGKVKVCFNNSNQAPLTMEPGTFFKAHFDRFTIQRDTGSVSTGADGRFIILKQDDVDYFEFPSEGANPGEVRATCGPAGATQQSRLTASGAANIPSLATDGMSLVGVEGFKFRIESASNITAGSLRLWWFDETAGNWLRGPIDEPISTGLPTAISSEYETKMGFGRVYAELVQGQNSGASGNITVIAIGGKP